MRTRYFEINGYWKDTKESIDGYIVCSAEYDEEIHENNDDNIFFYGLGKDELKKAVKLGEDFAGEFVVTSFDEISMNWTPEKKDEIERILINMWTKIGMDIPANFEDIVQDCYEDVCETADDKRWSEGDVAIAFRRWIEKQDED